MEEAFRAILLASAGVTALASTRVNYGEHPQGMAGPYIVLTVVDDAEGHTMTGPDGMSQGRVQVDCYAATYGAAKGLARAARVALDGYSGGSFGGVFLAATRDGREGGTNEADRPFRVSLDFLTHWSTS